MTEQLKPCPFCGGPAKTHGPYGFNRRWCISHNCKTFYNGGSEAFKEFPSESCAIAAWNTRHDPDQAWLDARDAEFDDRWNARMEP